MAPVGVGPDAVQTRLLELARHGAVPARLHAELADPHEADAHGPSVREVAAAVLVQRVAHVVLRGVERGDEQIPEPQAPLVRVERRHERLFRVPLALRERVVQIEGDVELVAAERAVEVVAEEHGEEAEDQEVPELAAEAPLRAAREQAPRRLDHRALGPILRPLRGLGLLVGRGLLLRLDAAAEEPHRAAVDRRRRRGQRLSCPLPLQSRCTQKGSPNHSPKGSKSLL